MGADLDLEKTSTWCYINELKVVDVMSKLRSRFFKTKAFAKQAAKAQIVDEELLRAGRDLAMGKGDSLGGNVWKKRLNKNMHRSIVVERVGDYWFFVYLYAKNDRENIDQAEEVAFKRLATLFEAMSNAQLDDQLKIKELLEIVSDGD